MSKRPALGSYYFTSAMSTWHNRGDRWYVQDGQFKKPLPRYFRDKLFSRHRRDMHRVEYLFADAERRDQEIERLSHHTTKPLELYYETIQTNSDLYLKMLRQQKLLKNKLL